MSETKPRWYRSPVDYEAWGNGYMPPSEHILIDALQRDSVKVISSTHFGDEGLGWWFVMENAGGGISEKRARLIRQMLEMDLETLVERFDDICEKQRAAAKDAEATQPSTGAP